VISKDLECNEATVSDSRKESLSVILEYAYKEYQIHAAERPRNHISHISIYLTMSALLFSAWSYVAMKLGFFNVVIDGVDPPKVPHYLWCLFVFVPIIVSFLFLIRSFTEGLFSLRFQHKTLLEIDKIKFLPIFLSIVEDKHTDSEVLHADVLRTLIKSISDSFGLFNKTSEYIDKSLDNMLKYLVISYFCILFEIIFYSILILIFK